MTLQDRTYRNEWMQNEDELKNILDEIAPPSIFNDIKQNKGAIWTPQFLVQCIFLLSTCNLPTLAVWDLRIIEHELYQADLTCVWHRKLQ